MIRRAATALLLAGSAAATPALEVELGYGHEFLTRGESWQAATLEATWRGAGRRELVLGVRELARFGERDLDLAAAASTALGERWNLGCEASASPTHAFTPAVTGALAVGWGGWRGFGVAAGAKWSRYATAAGPTDTAVGRLGVERYWGRYRVGWTGYLAAVEGELGGAHRISGDLFYGERGRIGLGLVAGRELESTGAGAVLATDVVGAALSGRHALRGPWALTWEAGLQRQGDLYTRTGARIGLRRQF
jgi:YaiO family outer membrane protein